MIEEKSARIVELKLPSFSEKACLKQSFEKDT